MKHALVSNGAYSSRAPETHRALDHVFRFTVRAALCLLPFLACVCSCGDADSEMQSRLVELAVSYQQPDPLLPWQNHEPGKRAGYGILIGQHRIITTESLLRNYTLVEMQMPRTNKKTPLAVETSDNQINLAVLRIDDPTFIDDPPPLPMTDRLSKQDEVRILQTDETGEPQEGVARIIQTAVLPLPQAPYTVLTFTLLTDLNVKAPGAPVIRKGKLAGIMMSYSTRTRTGSVLPYCVIRRFLDDVSQQPYGGVAEPGFTWKPLVDPAERAYSKIADREGGILVLSPPRPQDGTDSLLPKDVILEWDGSIIDNLGFYDDPDFGRLSFPYLIQGRRKPGDAVPVRIVRNSVEMTISVPLRRHNDELNLVPENVDRKRPEYLIEGGLIIRELDAQYLQGHGPDWRRKVDPLLVHTYLTARLAPHDEGERVVILAGLRPDAVNIGYQHLHNRIVTGVNGTPISNMGDVFRAVDRDGCLHHLALRSIGVELVLDPDELPEANARLSELYRIPFLQYRRSAP